MGSDLSAIAAILRGVDERPDGADRETYRRALDEIDRTDGNYLIVGEYDNQVGALTHLLVHPVLRRGGGRAAEIVGLWVAEPFRTSGIGALLLDHAVERARDLGCERMHVMTHDDRAFWERAGFIHLEAGYVRSLQPAAVGAMARR